MPYTSNTFPTGIQTPTIPTATDAVANFDHAGLESFQNDSVLALKNKIGVDGSVVTTSHDYKLNEIIGSDKTVGKAAAQTLTNKTLTSPAITNKTATGTDSGTETLSNKTLTSPVLTTPTISDFTNAQHSHQNATGGGTLVEASLALTDITTNNASITKHGLMQKYPNNTTTYLRADGNFSTIAGISRFGGTGADSALTIASGVTNIDLAGSQVVIKNYTSISITGTASVTFTNPHANGTTIIFKSQGNVTITTSATRAIDARGLGSTGGSQIGPNSGSAAPYMFGSGASISNNGITGSQSSYSIPTGANNSYGPFGVLYSGQIQTQNSPLIPTGLNLTVSKFLPLQPGTGGSSGNDPFNVNGMSGGAGGGAFYLECGGSYSASGTLDASGNAGTSATAGNRPGMGGGAGVIVILYAALTSNTGTYTIAGGAAGTGGAGGASAGGNGYALVAINTEFQ